MRQVVVFLTFLLIKVSAVSQGTFICGEPIMDADGNSYETLQIGDYCWTKSNMRTTTYASGTSVAKAFAYCSNIHPDTNLNVETFGRLYTWYSAVNLPEGSSANPPLDLYGYVQGICPVNWHIPTPIEISILNAYTAEELRSTEYWLQPNANTNSTGFSSKPAGYFLSSTNRFEGLLGVTAYWTDANNSDVFSLVSQESPNVASLSFLYYCDVPKKNENNADNNNDAISVRCVRKYCPIPDGDAQPCPGTPTVEDHEGNIYNTVQIGSQCWTKENMRCKTSPKGYLLAGGDNVSSLQPYYYENINSVIPSEERGLHYNWPAVVDSVFAANELVNFVNRRGICPEGWHVPSTDEWAEIATYLGTNCAYVCGNHSLAIGKAMGKENYWREYTGDDSKGECFPGKNMAINNSSGFSAVPAGYYNGNSKTFQADGNGADMWTSTSYEGVDNGTYGYDRSLTDFNQIGISGQSWERKHWGQTVRCVKNN